MQELKMGIVRGVNRWRKLCYALLAGVLPLVGTNFAHAHKINTSYTTLIVRPDTLKLMVVIDEYDLLNSFDLDKNGDALLWREEMLDGVDVVFGYVEEKVSLVVDGKPVGLERSKGDAQPDNKGNMFLNLFFRAGLDEPPVEVEMEVNFFTEFGSEHKNLAKVLLPGKPLQQAVFAEENTRQLFIVGERDVPLFDEILEMIREFFQ